MAPDAQATKPVSGAAPTAPDHADAAMIARAHERFASQRRHAERPRRSAGGPGVLPNLIVIGGLKCGTTSLHHYLNLHPEISMSRPKELNFFVAELNWELGAEWYGEHFSPGAAVRGETSPHYTDLPRLGGVAERMSSLLPHARIVYMVRNPIDRMLSHYLHNVGGGYEERPLEEALGSEETAYVDRSRYAFQLEPYLEAYGPERIRVLSREELKLNRTETMRSLFEFLGVNPDFSSEEFGREWETGGAKRRGRFRIMDRAVRLPGLRALDRNFDRLPEPLRWRIEKLVHDPASGEAPKPRLPGELRARLVEVLRPDVARLEEMAGRREFGWL